MKDLEKLSKAELIADIREIRKRQPSIVENALEESRVFNETLLSTSPDIIYIYDIVEYKNVYSNDGIMKILGYSSEEIRKLGDQLLQQLMHPDDFQIYLKETFPKYQQLRDNELHTHEYRMKHKSGDWYWLLSKELIFLRDPDGIPIQVFGLMSDITERKKAENELRENERVLNKVGNIAKIGGWKMDLKRGGKATWTEETYNIIGINQGDPIPGAEEHIDFYLPEFQEMIRTKMQDLIETRQNMGFEAQFRTKDGNLKWVQAMGEAVEEDGEVIELWGTLQDITERKQAEGALAESEQFFRSTFEDLQVGVVVNAADSSIVLSNPAACRILGLSAEQIAGKAVTDPLWNFVRVDGSDLPPEELPVARVISTGKSISNQIVGIMKPDHTEPTWANANAVPVFSEDNQLLRVICNFMDITERKSTEETVREQKNMFELVINSVPSRIFWKDLNSVYLGCNSSFLEAVKKNNIEDVIGKSDIDLIWAKEAQKYIDDDRQVIKKGISKLGYEEDYVLPGGKKIWWQSSKMPLKDDTGKIIGVLATSEDVTERKQAEKDLLESEQKLNTIIDTSPIGICTVDGLGKFSTTNVAFERMVGYSKEECRNLSLFDVTHPSDRPRNKKLFQSMFSKKTTGFSIEKRYIRKDGVIIDVAVHATGITDDDGNIKFGTAFVVDITERKQAEEVIGKLNEELEQKVIERTKNLAEKNKELERFNTLFVGREFRIKELKEQIKKLEN